MKKIIISILILLFGIGITNGLNSNDLFQSFDNYYKKYDLDLQLKKRNTVFDTIQSLKQKDYAQEKIELLNKLSNLSKNKIDGLKNFMIQNTSDYASNSQNLQNIRENLLKLVNQERQKIGKTKLKLNNKLNIAAQLHAQDMVKNNYFSHINKKGEEVTTRVNNQGYNYNYVGENIAFGQKTVEQVMKSWMSSPGHKLNILNSNYSDIGIGYYKNKWVQVFGKGF